MKANDENRPLTSAEYALARWMLENGSLEAREYLDQLDVAKVTPWRCPCGCASINFQIGDRPPAPPGVHVLGDYLFGPVEIPFGAFIYSCEGTLSGLEVYSFTSEIPSVLPQAPLRPFG
jgi:hypothetical protein